MLLIILYSIIVINILVVILVVFRKFFTYILGFALLAFYIFILTLGVR